MDSKLGKVQIIDGNSVLFLKQLIEIDKRVSFDLIFIDGRDFKFNQEYLDKIQANEFVVGSNLLKRTEEQLIDYLETNGRSFHSIKTDGYFSRVWRK